MSPFPNQGSLSESDRPSIASLLALLESVPALLWETDTELRFSCLAGAALPTVGVSPTLYTGKNVWHLFSPAENAQKARRAHEAALRGEASAFQADVNGRELQANVKPLRGPAGAIVGTIGIALDMTERGVAERALRLSEHSYRSLIDEAPYAMCRSTVSGALLQVNRAMTEMLGYDTACSSELLLRDLPFIFTPEGSFEMFQRALLNSGSLPGRDSVWVRRDGQSIQVLVSGRAVRDHAGGVSHLDVFAENVTEKKQLEAELCQAQRMQAIGQLAGGVAHDFNNLLTVINGHTEILLSGPVDTESRDRLGEIKQAADKAAALTRQLLAFSRRQVLRSHTVNLNEVIGKLTAMLSRLIKENVELVFVPGEDLGSVKADPIEVERVLLNLAVNAQDAMPDGGVLTIETANVRVDQRAALETDHVEAGDYIQILVRDTGVGMDQEIQGRVFEPFFRTKQSGDGTGLGLSVVYGVVRQSGGYISLESEPGEGTTFRIYLPRVAAAPMAMPESAPPAALPRGAETILVAEDDAAIRRLVVCALEDLGYHVLSAPDGAAAMSMAQSYSGEIHLLLSDLVMPTMGGRDLAAKLQGAIPSLKAAFISGYAGHAVPDEDLELAGACFIQKPFSMDLLAKTVRRVLDGSLPQRNVS